MTTLKEYATQLAPTNTKALNVALLPKVPTNTEIKEKVVPAGNGKEGFKFSYIVVDGLEYRVPQSVIAQLQTILKFAPNLEYFKVTKTGTTKDDTKYKVEPA